MAAQTDKMKYEQNQLKAKMEMKKNRYERALDMGC